MLVLQQLSPRKAPLLYQSTALEEEKIGGSAE